MISRVGIIGAGSMGTALAQRISSRAEEVILYGRKQEVVNSINDDRCNPDYFPGLLLNPNIRARLIAGNHGLEDCQAVLIAVPSSEVRSIVHAISHDLANKVIITVSKGLEYPSLKTMSEIIFEESNNPNIVCISGPNFADEIAYGHIAGATIGAADPSLSTMLSDLFGGFILDFSDDLRAVELCGVLKNVYAIGAGMWDSVYGNYNEHYTFLNMCYKEMCRFLREISSDWEIFTKFCCFGDFNLAAYVDIRRSRTLGLMVGKNIIKTPYLEPGVTFEGSKSVEGIIELGARHGIDMPIATLISDVLNGRSSIRNTVETLIRGPPRRTSRRVVRAG